DPWARALSHKARDRDGLLFGYDLGSPDKDTSFDTRDSGPVAPKSVVVDDAFDWQGDAPPEHPLEKLFLYQVHVKGFTAHRSSGVRNPGTYLGFLEKIPHLVSLGVNAVELLPVHEYRVGGALEGRRLTNYWGYDTLAYFAPESSYAVANPVTEF